ncbi:MAG: MFS transporter [Ignavibacteriales bacterium]
MTGDRGPVEGTAPAALSRWSVVGLTLGMSLSAAVFLTGYYMLLPVLPQFLRASGWQKSTIGALSSVFAVASLATRPAAGVLVDRSGPSRLLMVCGMLFLAVPALFTSSGTFLPLVAGQILAGLCVGAFTVASNGFLAIVAPVEHMGEITAWFSIALVAAKGFGSAVGTSLYDGLGYRWVLMFSAVLALLSLVVFLITRRTACPGGDGLRRQTAAPAAGSIPGGAARVEAKMNGQAVLLAALILITVTLSFGGIVTFMPIMAKERGLAGYGRYFVIQTTVVILVRLFSGRLVDTLGAFWVILVALVALSAGVALLAIATTPALLVLSAMLYGLGYGASFPSLTATVVQRTPVATRGRAFGYYTAAQDLGLALGQACGGLSQFASFRAIYSGMALGPLLSVAILMRLFGPAGRGPRG